MNAPASLALKILALAAAYIVTARLGLLLEPAAGFATLVWAPTGIALSMLMRFGLRLWPGVALGAFVVNLSIGASPFVAGGIAVGNTLEAVAGTYALVRWFEFRITLDRIKDVVALAVVAALSTAISASIGVLSLSLGGKIAPGDLMATWWAWWWGDLGGDLVVAPLLLTIGTATGQPAGKPHPVELVALCFTLILVSLLFFDGMTSISPRFAERPYFMFPGLAWAAVRFGPRGAALAIFFVAATAISGTTLGRGPFVHPTLRAGLLEMQTFLVVSATTTLLLAALAAERTRQLERSHEELEEEVEQRTAEYKRAEAKFRALIEAAPDAMVIVDRAGTIKLLNSQAERLFGYRAPEIIGQGIELLVPERYRALHAQHRAGYAEEPRARPMGTGLELFGLHHDGSEFPVEISLAPIVIEEGLLVSAAIRNIAERKSVETRLKDSVREKDVLLRELHHRVKNNLQIVASLLNLQASSLPGEDTRRAFEDSQDRIYSIALVHQLLYQSRDLGSIDFAGYLRDMAARLIDSYDISPDRVTFSVEAEAIPLSIDAAIPCGLIVNELVSNSIKHAFPGDRRGHVEISVRRDEGERLLLTVRDDGVGIPPGISFESAQTLGLQLVEALTRQIGGRVTLDREGGTAVSIHFVPPTRKPA